MFTRDIEKALHVANSVRAGTVWVNCYHVVIPQVPFGGFKESGIGREQYVVYIYLVGVLFMFLYYLLCVVFSGLEGIMQYCEVKTVDTFFYYLLLFAYFISNSSHCLFYRLQLTCHH